MSIFLKNNAKKAFSNQFSSLCQKGSIIAEYCWIDGTGIQMRSKSRTLTSGKVNKLEDLPWWNYDGSSTYQAVTHNSEVHLKPVAMYPDPMRGGDNILVMCETYTWADKEFKSQQPANTNFRHFCEPIYKAAEKEKPWFGIE